jgi:hypothetical protein
MQEKGGGHMRYLYICPKCKKVFSAEGEVPSKTQECAACEVKLYYTGYTKDEWDSKSSEEKTEIKEKALKQFVEAEISNETQIVKLLENLNKNIATVKDILVFFTVLFVISAIVTVIMISKIL